MADTEQVQFDQGDLNTPILLNPYTIVEDPEPGIILPISHQYTDHATSDHEFDAEPRKSSSASVCDKDTGDLMDGCREQVSDQSDVCNQLKNTVNENNDEIVLISPTEGVITLQGHSKVMAEKIESQGESQDPSYTEITLDVITDQSNCASEEETKQSQDRAQDCCIKDEIIGDDAQNDHGGKDSGGSIVSTRERFSENDINGNKIETGLAQDEDGSLLPKAQPRVSSRDASSSSEPSSVANVDVRQPDPLTVVRCCENSQAGCSILENSDRERNGHEVIDNSNSFRVDDQAIENSPDRQAEVPALENSGLVQARSQVKELSSGKSSAAASVNDEQSTSTASEDDTSNTSIGVRGVGLIRISLGENSRGSQQLANPAQQTSDAEGGAAQPHPGQRPSRTQFSPSSGRRSVHHEPSYAPRLADYGMPDDYPDLDDENDFDFVLAPVGPRHDEVPVRGPTDPELDLLNVDVQLLPNIPEHDGVEIEMVSSVDPTPGIEPLDPPVEQQSLADEQRETIVPENTTFLQLSTSSPTTNVQSSHSFQEDSGVPTENQTPCTMPSLQAQHVVSSSVPLTPMNAESQEGLDTVTIHDVDTPSPESSFEARDSSMNKNPDDNQEDAHREGAVKENPNRPVQTEKSDAHIRHREGDSDNFAHAAHDFDTLSEHESQSPVIAERERTDEDADKLLDNIIGEVKEKTMGPCAGRALAPKESPVLQVTEFSSDVTTNQEMEPETTTLPEEGNTQSNNMSEGPVAWSSDLEEYSHSNSVIQNDRSHISLVYQHENEDATLVSQLSDVFDMCSERPERAHDIALHGEQYGVDIYGQRHFQPYNSLMDSALMHHTERLASIAEEGSKEETEETFARLSKNATEMETFVDQNILNEDVDTQNDTGHVEVQTVANDKRDKEFDIRKNDFDNMSLTYAQIEVCDVSVGELPPSRHVAQTQCEIMGKHDICTSCAIQNSESESELVTNKIGKVQTNEVLDITNTIMVQTLSEGQADVACSTGELTETEDISSVDFKDCGIMAGLTQKVSQVVEASLTYVSTEENNEKYVAKEHQENKAPQEGGTLSVHDSVSEEKDTVNQTPSDLEDLSSLSEKFRPFPGDSMNEATSKTSMGEHEEMSGTLRLAATETFGCEGNNSSALSSQQINETKMSEKQSFYSGPKSFDSGICAESTHELENIPIEDSKSSNNRDDAESVKNEHTKSLHDSLSQNIEHEKEKTHTNELSTSYDINFTSENALPEKSCNDQSDQIENKIPQNCDILCTNSAEQEQIDIKDEDAREEEGEALSRIEAACQDIHVLQAAGNNAEATTIGDDAPAIINKIHGFHADMEKDLDTKAAKIGHDAFTTINKLHGFHAEIEKDLDDIVAFLNMSQLIDDDDVTEGSDSPYYHEGTEDPNYHSDIPGEPSDSLNVTEKSFDNCDVPRESEGTPADDLYITGKSGNYSNVMEKPETETNQPVLVPDTCIPTAMKKNNEIDENNALKHCELQLNHEGNQSRKQSTNDILEEDKTTNFECPDNPKTMALLGPESEAFITNEVNKTIKGLVESPVKRVETDSPLSQVKVEIELQNSQPSKAPDENNFPEISQDRPERPKAEIHEENAQSQKTEPTEYHCQSQEIEKIVESNETQGTDISNKISENHIINVKNINDELQKVERSKERADPQTFFNHQEPNDKCHGDGYLIAIEKVLPLQSKETDPNSHQDLGQQQRVREDGGGDQAEPQVDDIDSTDVTVAYNSNFNELNDYRNQDMWYLESSTTREEKTELSHGDEIKTELNSMHIVQAQTRVNDEGRSICEAMENEMIESSVTKNRIEFNEPNDLSNSQRGPGDAAGDNEDNLVSQEPGNTVHLAEQNRMKSVSETTVGQEGETSSYKEETFDQGTDHVDESSYAQCESWNHSNLKRNSPALSQNDLAAQDITENNRVTQPDLVQKATLFPENAKPMLNKGEILHTVEPLYAEIKDKAILLDNESKQAAFPTYCTTTLSESSESVDSENSSFQKTDKYNFGVLSGSQDSSFSPRKFLPCVTQNSDKPISGNLTEFSDRNLKDSDKIENITSSDLTNIRLPPLTNPPQPNLDPDVDLVAEPVNNKLESIAPSSLKPEFPEVEVSTVEDGNAISGNLAKGKASVRFMGLVPRPPTGAQTCGARQKLHKMSHTPRSISEHSERSESPASEDDRSKSRSGPSLSPSDCSSGRCDRSSDGEHSEDEKRERSTDRDSPRKQSRYSSSTSHSDDGSDRRSPSPTGSDTGRKSKYSDKDSIRGGSDRPDNKYIKSVGLPTDSYVGKSPEQSQCDVVDSGICSEPSLCTSMQSTKIENKALQKVRDLTPKAEGLKSNNLSPLKLLSSYTAKPPVEYRKLLREPLLPKRREQQTAQIKLIAQKSPSVAESVAKAKGDAPTKEKEGTDTNLGNAELPRNLGLRRTRLTDVGRITAQLPSQKGSAEKASAQKLYTPKKSRNPNSKLLTLEEFDRVWAEKKKEQSLAKLKRTKAVVDCHLSPNINDKNYRLRLRCKEKVRQNSNLALENLRFIDLLRDPKSKYGRDEHLRDFRKNYESMLKMARHPDAWDTPKGVGNVQSKPKAVQYRLNSVREFGDVKRSSHDKQRRP